MPTKRPLPIVAPDQLRHIPRSFAWIDHDLRSQGYLQPMLPAEMGLYLFLALAADARGLSCWRLDRIEREMPCFDRGALAEARRMLVHSRLLAFRPWIPGEIDGIYQLLPVRKRPRNEMCA